MHFQGNLLFPHWRWRHARPNPTQSGQTNTARLNTDRHGKKIIQENEYFRKPMASNQWRVKCKRGADSRRI